MSEETSTQTQWTKLTCLEQVVQKSAVLDTTRAERKTSGGSLIYIPRGPSVCLFVCLYFCTASARGVHKGLIGDARIEVRDIDRHTHAVLTLPQARRHLVRCAEAS